MDNILYCSTLYAQTLLLAISAPRLRGLQRSVLDGPVRAACPIDGRRIYSLVSQPRTASWLLVRALLAERSWIDALGCGLWRLQSFKDPQQKKD